MQNILISQESQSRLKISVMSSPLLSPLKIMLNEFEKVESQYPVRRENFFYDNQTYQAIMYTDYIYWSTGFSFWLRKRTGLISTKWRSYFFRNLK